MNTTIKSSPHLSLLNKPIKGSNCFKYCSKVRGYKLQLSLPIS